MKCACAAQKLVAMRQSSGVQAACFAVAPQLQHTALAARALAALGAASRTEDVTGAPCSAACLGSAQL